MTYAEYLIESARDEHALFEEMLTSDYKELALIKEGADEFQIRLLQEGTIETVWNAIKTAWKKFCEMFAKLFKTIVEKIKKLMSAIKAKFKKTNKSNNIESEKTLDIKLPSQDHFNYFISILDSISEYSKKSLKEILITILSDIKNEDDLLKKLDINCKLYELDDYFKGNFINTFEEYKIKNTSDAYNKEEEIIKNLAILTDIGCSYIDNFDKSMKEISNINYKTIENTFKDENFDPNAIISAFNLYKKVLSEVDNQIVNVIRTYTDIYGGVSAELISYIRSAKSNKEESQILYNIKSRSLNESDIDDDEDDGDYDEVDDEDIYYMADEFGDDDDIYYDAEDAEDEVDDYDLDDLEEGCCEKKSAKKECGDTPSTIEPIGSDESCCGKKEACCKKENNVELDSPDIALAPEEECGTSCVKKECTSVKPEVIANGPKADTVDAKLNITDNPNGATYDQTNSYSDDEAKADGLGLDGSIDTTLEDPFDSKETDLFSGVNFSELFW